MGTRKPSIDDIDDTDDDDGQTLKERAQDTDLKLHRADPDVVTNEDALGPGSELPDEPPSGGNPPLPRRE